ncbi:MAG: hypothetical protein ACRD9R_13430 [Pyrinomonadaceae bacterium]
MNYTPPQPNPLPRFRGLVLIWLAIISSVVMFFVVSRLLGPAAEEGVSATPPLFWVFAALGLATFGLSFLLKSRLLAQARQQRRPEVVSTAYILAFALSEASALFGLVSHFVTRSPFSVYLFALAALGLLLHKPKQAHLSEVQGEGNAGGFGTGL